MDTTGLIIGLLYLINGWTGEEQLLLRRLHSKQQAALLHRSIDPTRLDRTPARSPNAIYAMPAAAETVVAPAALETQQQQQNGEQQKGAEAATNGGGKGPVTSETMTR